MQPTRGTFRRGPRDCPLPLRGDVMPCGIEKRAQPLTLSPRPRPSRGLTTLGAGTIRVSSCRPSVHDYGSLTPPTYREPTPVGRRDSSRFGGPGPAERRAAQIDHVFVIVKENPRSTTSSSPTPDPRRAQVRRLSHWLALTARAPVELPLAFPVSTTVSARTAYWTRAPGPFRAWAQVERRRLLLRALFFPRAFRDYNAPRTPSPAAPRLTTGSLEAGVPLRTATVPRRSWARALRSPTSHVL